MAAASVRGHASFAVPSLNVACSPAGSVARCHAVAGSVLHVTGELPFVADIPAPESSHDALTALSVPAPAGVDAYSVPAAMTSELTSDSDHKHIRFSKTVDST